MVKEKPRPSGIAVPLRVFLIYGSLRESQALSRFSRGYALCGKNPAA